MNKTFHSAFLIAALAGITAFAQHGQPAPAAPAAPAGAQPADQTAPNAKPALAFEKTVHDFGRIGDEKPVSEKFKFKNQSDKTITIKNVGTSCGCTTAPLAKKVYAPGEDGEIEVTFNPANRRGKELKTIHIDTDDPNFARYDLQINIDVRPRVMMEPMIVTFGNIRKGSEGKTTMVILGRGNDFDVTKVTPRDSRIKVNKRSREQVERDGDKVWAVTLDFIAPIDLPIGQIRSVTDVETTDDQRKTLAIGTNVDVIGDVSVLPDRLPMQMAAANAPWYREIRLEHREQKAFEILGLDSESTPDMKISLDFEELTPGNKAIYRVRVSGMSPSTNGRVTGKIVIQTNMKDQEKIEIPISGNLSGAN
jgi:hypothetical protein